MLENKIVLLYQLADDLLVLAAEVEHADFALHLGHVVDNLVCLRLAEREIVTRAAEFADDIHESVYGEGIVLAADRKDGVAVLAALVVVLEKGRLFQHLPRVREEFVAFVCYGDTLVAAVENGDAHLFFEFVDGCGQARLRNEDALGGFGDVQRVGYRDGVFKLL